MKIVLIGKNGQLGHDIVTIFSKKKNLDLIALSHKDIEVTNKENLTKVMEKMQPTHIINTAAFHKVELCEEDHEKSFAVNAYAARNLAQYAKETDTVLIHFSTDYVFGLDNRRVKPYKETDIPGPLNTYGISKLAGEYFVRYIAPKHFVIRSSGLFGVAGASGKGGNFIETMIKKAAEGTVKVVSDQIMTPTSTLDIARNLLILMKTKHYGLYHMTSEGKCSWYDFAKEIFRQTKTKVDLQPISSLQSNSPVRRPAYSVLENAQLKQLGLNRMPKWQDALQEYLQLKKYV